MSSERVTVSLPDDVRRAAQRIAEERGTSFSAVVAEALTGWMRGRLVDAWLAEHQAAHGAFDENELRALAAEAGVPYVGRAGLAIRRREPGTRCGRADRHRPR
jgi:predicted transcriptional regulator